MIIPLSGELVKRSTPDAEATVRRTALGGLAAAIDGQFLLPTVRAVAGVYPASITAGSTEITSTGSTSATIAADLAAMLAAVPTPGAFRSLRRSIRPRKLRCSTPSAIVYSDAGQFDVTVSDETSVELDTAPTDPSTAATFFATAWGNNLVFVKVLRWLAWLRPLSGSVAWMTVSY